jgi:hypothetical protein
MRIQILSDWTYTPKFAGNRDEPENEQMKVTFHPLSGKEELEISSAGGFSFDQVILRAISKIENPPNLVDQNGKEKKATKDDIAQRSELKGLFYELVGEYSDVTKLGEKEQLNLK